MRDCLAIDPPGLAETYTYPLEASLLLQSKARWVYSTCIPANLSENPSEIQLVKELWPDFTSYPDVYDDHGLLTERTIWPCHSS
jgi:hypothetical protein